MSGTRRIRVWWWGTIAVALVLPRAALLQATDEAGTAAADKRLSDAERRQALEKDVTQGALRVVNDDGAVVECPLRHTDVQADISGFIARVKVTQTFYNPTDERIEAVYVFPLPHEAAVDDMTMVVGDRKIVGIIKRRAEARRIYQQALAAGQTAALLEQERPNIFTQSVGNIDPGQEVNIEIRYVDVLAYDMGAYEFHFPMVVGPRFNPGAPIRAPQPTPPELQGRVSPPVPDTTAVPDASRISPPVLQPGQRNGHNISLALRLEAGVPIQGLKVANHQAEIVRDGDSRAEVTLSPADAIPNKDFVLRYYVMGKKPEMAMLAHTGAYTDSQRLGHGYFMLMIQPKEDERLTKSPPREIVFLLDVSGSMSGQPTAKVKEAMREMLKLCRPIDTMQVITFAGRTQQLFDKPVPVNDRNVATALNFTQRIRGSGGTYMLEGVKRAIDQPIDDKRVRIVIMLTDGYIGNEAQIIEHVGKSCGDQIRFWAIGIGSSPNMFLIDGVARQGGGMGKRLGLNDPAAGLAEEVVTRIQRAQLAKIRIDWGGLQVAETYPAKIPELWAGRPVIVFGRYTGGGAARIELHGVVEGEAVSWPLQVALPENQPDHGVLAKVWARKKIEDLMQQTYYMGSPAVEEEVTAMALDYRLMSQYTSFVAVDANKAEEIAGERPARPPRRMLVPVPLPEGTQWEGFFGPLGEGADDVDELAATALFKKDKLQTYSGFAPGKTMSYGMGLGGAMGRFGGAMPADQPMLAGGMGLSVNGPAPVLLRQQAAAIPARRRALKASAVREKARHSFLRMPSSPAARRPHPTLPSPAGAVEEPLAESLRAVGDLSEAEAAGGTYTAMALTADAEKIAKTAGALLDAARKQRDKKALDAAHDELVRGYFLAAAAAGRGHHQAQQMASTALAELQALHADRVAAWKSRLPALDTKLDLVLRNLSVAEALDAVSAAAGLKIRLIEGSVDDARAMLTGRDARLTYLDLRGATVAEALDWILQPLRLTWQPNAGTGAAKAILAGSQRRMPQATAWVYDVSAIALPAQKEFEGIGDAKQAATKAKEDARQFIDAMRKTLNASADDVMWFAPGQLLVLGNPERHRQTADAIAGLSDPAVRLAGPLATLHKKTAARAAARRQTLQKIRALRRRIHTIAVHDQFSWPLLAAALAGRVDQEALTELGIAWQAPETKELLAGTGAGTALRSAWTVTAASGMLADDEELAELARLVRRQCKPAAEKAVSALRQSPQNAAALFRAVYGGLAMGDERLRADAVAALPDAGTGSPAVTAAASAARVLLRGPGPADRQQLASQIAAGGIAGEDLTVLAAMACRRAAGETWTAFRAERREILGRQPLPGSVVVLVNRLSGHRFQ